MSDERLTTDAAIKYLESIIYEDFAPYTQKCLLKVIEAARKEESMTAEWERRMERIVEKLEEKSMMVATSKEFWDNPQKGEYVMNVIPFQEAIEIVKAGGVDEVD